MWRGWHSLECLAPGSVLLGTKDGPYAPPMLADFISGSCGSDSSSVSCGSGAEDVS